MKNKQISSRKSMSGIVNGRKKAGGQSTKNGGKRDFRIVSKEKYDQVVTQHAAAINNAVQVQKENDCQKIALRALRNKLTKLENEKKELGNELADAKTKIKSLQLKEQADHQIIISGTKSNDKLEKANVSLKNELDVLRKKLMGKREFLKQQNHGLFKVITQKNKKIFLCQCKETFERKYCLNRHVEVLLNPLRYVCKHCERSFSSASNRDRHVKTFQKSSKCRK